MLGSESEITISAVRLWVAAGSAALLVVVCSIAFIRARYATPNSAVRSAAVVVAAVLGAAMAWAFLGSASDREQSAERRALEMRAQELTQRTLAPGSPLSCLDGLAGANVETACERAIFATPANVAMAMSYVVARLALLSDMATYARLSGADIDDTALPLQRALENDRFGLLAHALAMRDRCTSENCKALDVLQDSSRVRANMRDDTFDRYLEHYALVWAQSPEGQVAPVQVAPVADAAAQPGAPGPRKVTVNIDFPSSASIPPVSIMAPEKGSAPSASPAAGNSNPQSATTTAARRQSRKQTANPPAVSGMPAAPAEAVDPVWMPAAPAPAAQSAATVAPAAAPPIANAAPNTAAPTWLGPFAPQPEPNPGTTRAE